MKIVKAQYMTTAQLQTAIIVECNEQRLHELKNEVNDRILTGKYTPKQHCKHTDLNK